MCQACPNSDVCLGLVIVLSFLARLDFYQAGVFDSPAFTLTDLVRGFCNVICDDLFCGTQRLSAVLCTRSRVYEHYFKRVV